MTFGDKVVAEALEWVGTPFVWGQSQKDVGCDCRGLITGVARELGRREAECLYATLAGYRVDRAVPGSLLLEGMEATFLPAKAILPGCVLLLKHKLTGRPAHMAIAVSSERAVHAFPGRRSQVCERDLRVLFHKFPLHSVWRWKR